jgi:triosephosphate isomerase
MKLLAGNWKMNNTLEEGATLVAQLIDGLPASEVGDVRVVISPPFLQLPQTVDALWENAHIAVAAQNGHAADGGAFTGEISMAMLRDTEVDAVILGHSERRQYFGETDAEVAAKVKSALKHQLIPIICVGEVLEQRKAGTYLEDTWRQLHTALEGVGADDLTDCVIAYEPVWAIGTGEVATPAQAQEMHAYLRAQLKETFGTGELPILYGGSCKPSNAEEIFAQPDVDGGLIGGASLVAADFIQLVKQLRDA